MQLKYRCRLADEIRSLRRSGIAYGEDVNFECLGSTISTRHLRRVRNRMRLAASAPRQ